MEAVVVVVDAVVNVDAVEADIGALNRPDAVVGAGIEKDVADEKILATIEKQKMRTMIAADPGRGALAADAGAESVALSVDSSRSFDADVLRPDGEDQANVAVFQCGIAAQGDSVGSAVLLSIGAAQELAAGADAQRDIAF